MNDVVVTSAPPSLKNPSTAYLIYTKKLNMNKPNNSFITVMTLASDMMNKCDQQSMKTFQNKVDSNFLFHSGGISMFVCMYISKR